MITIKLSNKLAYTLIAILTILTASLVVYAYNTIPANPAVMGHTCNEIEGGCGGRFGNWVDMSAAASGGATQGPAATDGFVVADINCVGCTLFTLVGYTDNSNPPTTRQVSTSGSGESSYQSFTMPVRKGDYWIVKGRKGLIIGVIGSIQWFNTTNFTIYWIPTG